MHNYGDIRPNKCRPIEKNLLSQKGIRHAKAAHNTPCRDSRPKSNEKVTDKRPFNDGIITGKAPAGLHISDNSEGIKPRFKRGKAWIKYGYSVELATKEGGQT